LLMNDTKRFLLSLHVESETLRSTMEKKALDTYWRERRKKVARELLARKA
jgi:hypothetical protein